MAEALLKRWAELLLSAMLDAVISDNADAAQPYSLVGRIGAPAVRGRFSEEPSVRFNGGRVRRALRLLAESNSAAWLGVRRAGRGVGKICAPLESRT